MSQHVNYVYRACGTPITVVEVVASPSAQRHARLPTRGVSAAFGSDAASRLFRSLFTVSIGTDDVAGSGQRHVRRPRPRSSIGSRSLAGQQPDLASTSSRADGNVSTNAHPHIDAPRSAGDLPPATVRR